MNSPLQLVYDERWLEVRFPEPQQMLSWAIVGGGRQLADRVVWHYVTRSELAHDVDPVALL